MYGENEYKFDKFKDDLETAEVDAEDKAEDTQNALEEAGDKFTASQLDALRDIIDTVDSHFDQDPEEADHIYEMINELVEDVAGSDQEELADRQEEIEDKIRSLERSSRDLGKN